MICRMLKRLFKSEKPAIPKEVQWFSVEEKLPEDDRLVRLGVINGNVPYADTGYFKDGEWFNTSSGAFGSSSLYAVTSWRELVESDSDYGAKVEANSAEVGK